MSWGPPYNEQRRLLDQRKRQQQQKQLKLGCGDDNQIAGPSSRKLHYTFLQVQANPFATKPCKSDSSPKGKLNSDGNLRTAKKSAERNYPTSEEEINKIRDILQNAYEDFILGSKVEQVYKTRTATEAIYFYLVKLTGCLSKIKRQDKERRKTNGDANEYTASEVVTFKERIKKLLDNIQDEKSVQKKPVSAMDMLDYIESALHDNQREMKRYEQERECVEKEIEELSKDVSDLSKIREVHATDNDACEGIQRKIRYIRLRIDRQKRAISARQDEEHDNIRKELHCLSNDVDGVYKVCKLQISEDNENEALKTIRQIRKKLESEKRHQTERRLELENKCKDQSETFEELWKILNEEEQQPKQELKQFRRHDNDSISNGKIIVENLNRWKRDKTQLVTLAGMLLKDISTLLSKEPFSFTCSKQFDTPKLAKGLTPASQQVLISIYDIKQCLEENCKSFEKKLLSVKLFTEMRECQTEVRKDMKELKKENDELLNKQLELENNCKDQSKTLEELLNILNEGEQQPKHKRKPFERYDNVDGISNGKIIVEHLNRWKRDKTQLVTLAGMLFKEISTLLSKEPFSFTLPKQSDTPKIAKGLTPASQQVIIGIIDIKQCLEENCKSFEKKFVSVKLLTEARECQTDLRKEIKGLKKENDELLNRLSKLAGANLTDNNPAIADLSDPNRATKLAEQFSELYDTPWTDAFDALDTDDEKRCIEYLLNIIVESYKLCEEISVMQQDTLTRALCRPLEGLTIKENTIKMKHDRDVHLSKIQSKTLSDLRKQTADFSIVDVKTHIAAKNVHWVKKSDLKHFTMSCIELCWYMHLQSPPVYLDATLMTDSKFDSNKYKSYTKSGKKVDFLVWPSLLLHKDGPLLCKGVAQGK